MHAVTMRKAQARLRLVAAHAAQDRLFRLVEALKGPDPLSPLTVVGPSNYADLSLRHALGKRGLVNVRFLVLPRLVELLGAPALAAQGLRPLTPLLESAAVRAVASHAQGALAEVRDHASLHATLRATFRDLRHVGPEALTRLAAMDPLRAEVVRLYRLFLERTAASYYDREALAQAAADAVRRLGSAAPGLRDLGPIVFFLVDDLSPGERALVEALAARWTCAAVLGLTGDPEADVAARVQAALLADALPTAEEAQAPLSAALSHILIAPDAQQEARWALQSVLRAARQGVPLHRVALLYRQQTPYGPLLRDQLQMAGVPMAGPGGVTLRETAAGRTLLGLMGLADGALPRDAAMDWLTGCPVWPPDGVARRSFSPSRWDALSREAGIVGGAAQWQDRLERHAREMERRAEEAESGVGEQISEAAALFMRRQAEAARGLASFVAGLAQDLQPPPEPQPWSAFAQWARRLLDRYHGPHGQPPAEADALARIQDLLREMEAIDEEIEPSGATLARFIRTLEEALDAPVGHLGRTGEGVFVGPVGAAQGMEFDLVHVLGMTEGAFPPRAADDPLVPDVDRQRAGGLDAGLPLRGARHADERRAYLSALAGAQARVLSFPRADLAAQRELHPSRWLLEEASRLDGSRVHSSTLASHIGKPWLTVVASMEDGLRAGADRAADGHDYDLGRLWRWRHAARPVAVHHLAQGGLLQRTLALMGGRRSPHVTLWDGDVSELAGAAARLDPLGRGVLSPTSLETWAACPFRHFLGRVLRVAASDKPEETLTITPLERGSLIHRILERFMKQVMDRWGAPAPGVGWTAEQRRLLHEIAVEEFQDAEARGLTGKALLWEIERAAILSDLDAFLEEDARQRARLGVVPHALEMRLDGRSDPWDVPGVGPLALRAVVDRVDVSPDGGLALVLDYKTGLSEPYAALGKDPVDRGRRLQLPAYAHAVRRALGDGVRVLAAYWFVTARGGFKLAPPQPADLDAMTRPFNEAIGVIVGGIRSGLFPANPGKETNNGGFESCRICEFQTVCPPASRRDVVWRRKSAGDPRLAPYLSLAGIAQDSGESDDQAGG
jgi:hypothetical protein